MNFSKQDVQLMEELLRQALQRNPDPDQTRRYHELLKRIQHETPKTSSAFADGFRYDYDDPSQV